MLYQFGLLGIAARLLPRSDWLGERDEPNTEQDGRFPEATEVIGGLGLKVLPVIVLPLARLSLG